MTTPKTVRVRIAVAVNQHGEWSARGDDGCSDEDIMRRAATAFIRRCSFRFVEADIPIPQPQTIEGEVKS